MSDAPEQIEQTQTAQLEQSQSEPLPPDLPILPAKYQIRKLLGKGNMAVVLDAFDEVLQREVAIKIQLLNCNGADGKLRERFILEAKTLLQLDHPNIVKMLSSGFSQDGQPYIVMEKLRGNSLKEEIGEGKTLNPSRFLSLFIQLISGLDFAHRQGIVHRDLKPGNIFLSQDQTGICVKLIDFGLARELEVEEESKAVTLTKTAAVIGTPSYMSPEQCLGKTADLSSDIYALGCVMYEAITGFPPFKAESPLELIYKHVNADWERLELLADTTQSKKLARLVDSCLNKQADLRPTAALLLANLERTREEMTSSGKLYYGREKPRKNPGGLMKIASTIVAIAWLAIAGASFLKQQQTVDTKKNIDEIDNKKTASNDEKLLKQYRADFERAEKLLAQARDPAEHERYEESYLKAARLYANRCGFNQKGAAEKVLKKLLANLDQNDAYKFMKADVYRRLGDCIQTLPGRADEAENLYKKAIVLSTNASTGDRGINGIAYAQFLINQNRQADASTALKDNIPYLRHDKLAILEGHLHADYGNKHTQEERSERAERDLLGLLDMLYHSKITDDRNKTGTLQVCNQVMSYLISQDSKIASSAYIPIQYLIAKTRSNNKEYKAALEQTNALLAKIKKMKPEK